MLVFVYNFYALYLIILLFCVIFLNLKVFMSFIVLFNFKNKKKNYKEVLMLTNKILITTNFNKI